MCWGATGLWKVSRTRRSPSRWIWRSRPISATPRDDDLHKTVDYSLVVERAGAIVAGHRYRLLEALAGAIASGVLEIPAVDAVTVTVRKLRPPVAADMSSAGVRLRRERGGDRSA